MRPWLANLVIGAAILVVAPITMLVVVPASKAIETAFLPVVKHMSFSLVPSEVFGGVTFSVTGEKVRDCTLQSLYTLVLVDGQWVRGVLETSAGVVSPATTRPKGTQYFGHWSVVPSGDQIRFVATHRCHSVWDTVTEVGRITLS